MSNNSTVSAGYGVIAAKGLIPIANNYVMANTSGATAFPTGVAISALPGVGLTIGTSAISGGTTTRVLYDNGGVLGEYVVTGSTNVVMSASPTLTGTIIAAGLTLSAALAVTGLSETYTAPTITSNVLTINLALGTIFNVANTANITTFTISNPVASRGNSFTLVITANGTPFTQAWGSSVVWAGGVAPALTTANGKRDIITFMTNDGGTTWFGMVGGQNF